MAEPAAKELAFTASKKEVDPLLKLKFNPFTGEILEVVENFVIILGSDPNLGRLAKNEMTQRLIVAKPYPWTKACDEAEFSDSDAANIRNYISDRYGMYSTKKCDDAILVVANRNRYHPVREYLEACGDWDGVPRLETLLIDFLGAEDSEYVRRVTKITLVAAVARVYKPGIKFDTMLILVGPQGIGKSQIFYRLAGVDGEFFADSLSIEDFANAKVAYEKTSGAWIVECPELTGMSKSDENAVKAFLTSTESLFRPAYGRYPIHAKKQFICVGSTNQIDGFLRDATGGRRFYPVEVPGGKEKTPFDLTEDYVRQVWAEAKGLFDSGEPIYIAADDPALSTAKELQQRFLVNDDRSGVVEKYLNLPIPDVWDRYASKRRYEYFQNPPYFHEADYGEGFRRRDKVSNIEIAVECLGLELSKVDTKTRNEIRLIMAQLPEWKRSNKSEIFPPYGRQRYYERVTEQAETAVPEETEELLGV